MAISLSIMCSLPWHLALSMILSAKSCLVPRDLHFRTTAKLPSPMISPTTYFWPTSLGGIKEWSWTIIELPLSESTVIDDPFRGLSRVLEDAEVLRLRLAGCRLDRNFLRLVLGLALCCENFSYLASNSGLFRMDWTFLQCEWEHNHE